MHADPSVPTESDPHLARLAAVWGLKREDEWFVQRKENMSPWKVSSASQTRDHDRLWLLFSVHKFCRGKSGFEQEQTEGAKWRD